MNESIYENYERAAKEMGVPVPAITQLASHYNLTAEMLEILILQAQAMKRAPYSPLWKEVKATLELMAEQGGDDD